MTIRHNALAAFLAAVTIAAAGNMTGCSRRIIEATCATTPAVADDPHAPVIAVLTGITTDDLSPAIADERRAALAMIIGNGFDRHAHLILDGIGRGLQDSQPVETDLIPQGASDVYRRADRRCRTEQILDAYRRTLVTPVDGPTDIPAALDAMARHVAALPRHGPIELLVFSDMLNANPPALLSDPDVLAQEPAALVEQLKRARQLPDCAGWTVGVAGAGRAATGGLGSAADYRLQRFWATVFKSCGAKLVLYDSRLTRWPVEGPAIEPGPPIEWIWHPVPTDHGIEITLPDDLLFETGSASLGIDAGPALTAVAEEVGHHSGADISVAGYTDSTGEPAANQLLSERRAAAVAHALIKHGVVNHITAVGYGQTRPIAAEDTPTGRAQNRRVTITITG